MKRKSMASEDDMATPGASGWFTRKGGALAAGCGLLLMLSVLIYLAIITRDLPSLQQLESYKPKLSSKVYSADLKLIHEYYVEKRSFVALDELPEDLVQAVIATEDRKFYDHWGMDVRRLFGAVIKNVVSASFKEGASTLTQQLARQLYLTREKTIGRKIRELITAVQIERTYTKPEILEMYLNHMYFGHGSHGAQSAALQYFGKDVRNLNVQECALLVGLLKAPEAYTPRRHPDRALSRRNVVLNAMREVHYLSDESYEEAVKTPITLAKRYQRKNDLAPYFTEYIRQVMQKKYGYDLYTDGLSIYTTLDSRAQYLAEKIIDKQMSKLQKQVNTYYKKKDLVKRFLSPEQREDENYAAVMQDTVFVDSLLNVKAQAQVALVSIDPRNGHILAFVGGRDFEESKYNRAIQAHRQPGSAFKPFIYTVAIDNGYPPTQEVLNQPVVVMMENGERWSPQNYDHSVGGPTTFREALRKSYNLVTVRVLQSLIQKPSLVVEYAHKMGIKSPLQPVDAIALGASDVTPMELTSAYSTFANGGVLVEPLAILRVEDKFGNVIEQNQPRSQEVLRPETAYLVTDMLRTVIDKGTGGSARWRYKFYRPAAGKTGTTNDYSDAWFVGFTPQVTTGVWVGIDDFTLTLGRQTGSSAALPIWAPYMKAVHDTLELPEADFEMPEGVVRVNICEDSKLLAKDTCPCKVVEEVFFSNLAPTQYCDDNINITRKKSRRQTKRRRF